MAHALRLAEEGADLVDVGGESTRPGAPPVPVEEELRRVVPVIEALRARRFPLPISVDTWKGAVARAALDAGADLVNDVTGLSDPELGRAVAAARVPVVLMHTPRHARRHAVPGGLRRRRRRRSSPSSGARSPGPPPPASSPRP